MEIDRDRIEAANDATYAAWNAHDPDAVAAVFAADAELLDAGSPEPVRGREAIRARAAACWRHSATSTWSASTC